MHLLRVHLVERPVDAHGGAQARHPLVVLEAVEDGAQGGGDEVGRAEGHDGADVLHGNAVLVRRLHAQTGQDLFGFGEALFAPANHSATGIS